jgi:hypothetical protein
MRHEIKGLIDEETTEKEMVIDGDTSIPTTIKVDKFDNKTRVGITTHTLDTFKHKKCIGSNSVVLEDDEVEKLATMLQDSIKDIKDGEN